MKLFYLPDGNLDTSARRTFTLNPPFDLGFFQDVLYMTASVLLTTRFSAQVSLPSAISGDVALATSMTTTRADIKPVGEASC